ncbi:MAG: hypothetical protein LKE52_04145 [Bacilli bacterium]|nr:hypothetical protein [Bacilli bacterium]
MAYSRNPYYDNAEEIVDGNTRKIYQIPDSLSTSRAAADRALLLPMLSASILKPAR